MGSRSPIAWLLAGLAPLAGCSYGHTFTLADLDALALGTSTRSQVEQRLGKPRDVGARLPHEVYHSTRLTVSPPAPLPLITWPLFWGQRHEEYAVAARFDDQGVLRQASLTIDGESRAFFLLLIQPHLLAPTLEREQLAQLRSLEAKGMKVVIHAYFGDISVEEYERSFLAPDVQD